MIKWLIDKLTGGLVDKVFDLVKSYQNRKLSEQEIRANLERDLKQIVAGVVETHIKESADVIKAEIRGENWLQRNWRPLVALSFAVSYLYVIVIVPHLVYFGWLEPLGFGEQGLQNMFYLVLTFGGGYMGLRSVEKILKVR